MNTHPHTIDAQATRGLISAVVLIVGFVYNFGWIAFALGTMWLDRHQHGAKGERVAMG